MNQNENLIPVTNESAVVYNPADAAGTDLLADLQNPNAKLFCSMIDDGTRSSKVKIYNAISGEALQLIDFVNQTLEIVDVIAHPIMLTDEVTGEYTEQLRTVLVAADGTCYQAVSQGVIKSLRNIMAVVGMPSWAHDPLKVVPVQITTSKKFKVLNLKLVD